MDGQFLLTLVAFGVAATVVSLTATGILPRPTAMIDAWSVTRPTIPRQWLTAAFWCTFTLPVVGCGIFAGTAGRFLPTAWNDLAQFLLWLSMTVDAVIAQRRILLAVAVVFLAFSAYEVATHL